MSKQQRVNIWFCYLNGNSAAETYRILKNTYGDKCLSKTQVFEWHRRFKQGREVVDDNERSGRPAEVITKQNVEKVRDFVKKTKKSSLRLMELELGISKTTIHRILTEKLGIRIVNSKFVPHQVTDRHKLNTETTEKLEETKTS